MVELITYYNPKKKVLYSRFKKHYSCITPPDNVTNGYGHILVSRYVIYDRHFVDLDTYRNRLFIQEPKKKTWFFKRIKR